MKPKSNPPPARPVRTSRTQVWLLGLLLVAATILAYRPAWNAGFIWDDDDYVTHNPLLTAPDGWQRIWFSLDSPSQYFPLTYTAFRIERSLWGLNPAGYHWVNLLLHAVNALLVWRLLRRLSVPGAWFAAAVFALHPVQVESVAWISELKNVASLFFSLLALLAWVEFVRDRPAWRWYGLALLFYALALFSKTTACVMPAAFLLVLWLKRKPIDGARLLAVVPFALLGLAMGVVSMWWERHHQGTVGESYSLGLLERLLIASRAVWFYLGKLAWPANLSFNYPLWKITPADPLAYLWPAAGLGLCAAIYYSRRLAGRSVETAAVFFVATLSPLLGFIMLYTFRYSYVTDHYQYVAMIGPAALAAAGISVALDRWERTRKVPAICLRCALGAALLFGLGALTWQQSRSYHDLETLWRTTLERNPASFMAHNNLGAIRLAQGRVDEAMTHFQRALQIHPAHANAHGNLGHALLQKGRVDEAITHFEKALDLEPGAKAHSDLGFSLLQTDRVDEAIAHFRSAVELQPGFAEAHNNLGLGLLQKNQPSEAIAEFETALKLDPGSADAVHNLGSALLHQGRWNDAIAQFRRALELRPRFAQAHSHLGIALFQNGQADEAFVHFRKALDLDPADKEALSNLSWGLLQAGRADEAIGCFETALKNEPGSAEAHCNLARVFFQRGRLEEAIVHFQKAVEIQPRDAEIRNNLGWALLQNGRVDDAIGSFETVLKLQPQFVLAHNNLALAFLREGKASDAIAQYQSFLKAEPEHAPVLSDLAWVLATWPDASIRNGAQAVDLAQRANQLSGDGNPRILRALAAAYAENGRFAEAAATAERALQLADSRSDAALGGAIRSQIQTYKAGAPFRDSSAMDAPSGPAAPGQLPRQ